MSGKVIKFPNFYGEGSYASFVYSMFPWLNAQISARSKENKEEKILKTKNIKNGNKERREITELFEQVETSKKLTNKRSLNENARRNFRKHTAIRQTSFAQIPPSAELRIAAEMLGVIGRCGLEEKTIKINEGVL